MTRTVPAGVHPWTRRGDACWVILSPDIRLGCRFFHTPAQARAVIDLAKTGVREIAIAPGELP